MHMTSMELIDEPAAVTSRTDDEGQISPRRLIWRNRFYQIVSVGRQWEEPEGRFILVEVSDGTRFELLLRRKDLSWRVKKVWWGRVFV